MKNITAFETLKKNSKITWPFSMHKIAHSKIPYNLQATSAEKEMKRKHSEKYGKDWIKLLKPEAPKYHRKTASTWTQNTLLPSIYWIV